jgi:hypothetical protein
MAEWEYSSTILELGSRLRRVISFTPRPLYSRGKIPPVPTGYDPRIGMDIVEKRKNFSCRDSKPGLLTCSPSLYRLSYLDS